MDEIDPTELKNYLLGSVTDDVRERLEQRLMTEDTVFEELEAAEDDLIDEYLGNDLSATERESFVSHFLAAPERLQRLAFAKSFKAYVDRIPAKKKGLSLGQFWTSRSPLFRFASAVAVLAIAVGAAWLYLSQTRPTHTFASLTLAPSAATRELGAAPTRIALPADIDELRISLKLPFGTNPATLDHVNLLSEAGGTQRLEISARQPDAVNLVVPKRLLSRGQYALKLFERNTSGTEQPVNGSYLFTVE
jgi:hypothetical protein